METCCETHDLRNLELLLAGCRFGHSAYLGEDFLFAQDQISLIIDGDLVTGVFAEQNPVANRDIERHSLAFLNLASPASYPFALLRLFFCPSPPADAPF